MSQPKHTPGPWHRHSEHSTAVNKGKKHIALVNIYKEGGPNDVFGEEFEGNVHLIAAAPCLLARLESMAAQHACGCGHPACNRCADDRLNQEVIERAKGGAE